MNPRESSERQRDVFRRCDGNPILTAKDIPFSAATVLNPGAAEAGGEVILLVRIEDTAGFSNIHVARGEDGVSSWRVEEEPLLRHGLPEWEYEAWGCEDARVLYVPDDDMWYITYVAYSSMGPAVGIARTKDFRDAERVGLLGSTDDKDGVLFPVRFPSRHGERWAILHRPDAAGAQHIWLSYSPDFIHWGEPHCILREGVGPAWNNVKVGAGPPPLEVEEGWLLLFHGVKEHAGAYVYRVGVALLDRCAPHKVLGATPGFIFQAEAPYETSGLVPNVVFPTGLLRRGGELWLYYGGADSCVCLARANLDDVMATLRPHERTRGRFSRHQAQCAWDGD